MEAQLYPHRGVHIVIRRDRLVVAQGVNASGIRDIDSTL